jgi:hypothetical protein
VPGAPRGDSHGTTVGVPWTLSSFGVGDRECAVLATAHASAAECHVFSAANGLRYAVFVNTVREGDRAISLVTWNAFYYVPATIAVDGVASPLLGPLVVAGVPRAVVVTTRAGRVAARWPTSQ